MTFKWEDPLATLSSRRPKVFELEEEQFSNPSEQGLPRSANNGCSGFKIFHLPRPIKLSGIIGVGGRVTCAMLEVGWFKRHDCWLITRIIREGFRVRSFQLMSYNISQIIWMTMTSEILRKESGVVSCNCLIWSRATFFEALRTAVLRHIYLIFERVVLIRAPKNIPTMLANCTRGLKCSSPLSSPSFPPQWQMFPACRTERERERERERMGEEQR